MLKNDTACGIVGAGSWGELKSMELCKDGENKSK